MLKRLLVLLTFLFLVFGFGIVAENKIRHYLSQQSYLQRKPITQEATKIRIDSNENREIVRVLRVIDGDTIELEDKRRVRYIGVNAPEMTDKRPVILCVAKMSKMKNQELVGGKIIEMEKDISDKDKYGRLLRYVWIEGEMINLKMIETGHARTATYPPDVKYKDLFVAAEKTAKKVTCNKT